MKKSIVVFGAGQHARVVVDAAEKSGAFQIVAFVDDVKAGQTYFDYPVWSKTQFSSSIHKACIIAVGDNFVRGKIAEELSRENVEFVSVIHPSAQVARDVEIGAGAFFAAGTIVNPGARIGDHVLLNTKAAVEHDCRIERGSSVGPGATLSGNVTVGARTAIASGVVISHGIKIGSDSVVGLGAVVVNDVPSQVVAFGNPCAVVRSREQGEKYL